MIPFAAKITNVTATQPPIQIPAKTKLSFLSIYVKNQFNCLLNAFVTL